ncbi:MAG TPA: glycoside hydrolase family 38 C-terminal domain-containing protein [Dehalococcoidia bacterium]|nr:glycoside hydrolase family 38 C-terminal domain-containing protein [Dehalococcoidia bacterium]
MEDDSGWQFVVISHSHWDREWYVPFQTYRIRLVGLMDRVLELLAGNPEYKHFMTDGQTALLEDYLAVRPERRRLIARLVRQGRLLIGPWYVAPDEFLPGGESLIRNLQRGTRLSREFGEAMRIGYSPDAFGHIAHLPAILRGFGFDCAVVWRGLDDRIGKTEFIWESPDGSRVLTLHLRLGYASAWPLSTDPKKLVDKLSRIKRELAPHATTRYLAVMNGNDHAPPQPELPTTLEAANSLLPDGRMFHSNLPQLMGAIEEQLRKRRAVLPRFRGEMRSGQRAHLLPGAISARMWVKQRNQQCEDLLVGWLEPATAWCGLLRKRLGRAWREPPLPWGPFTGYPAAWSSISGLVREAWRHLLLNQSHDPIYGCGVDEVYVDVTERFDACEQIGENLVRRMLADIAAQVDNGGAPSVVVFNPLGGPRTDFVTFDWPVSDDGQAPLALVDSAGRRHACQTVTAGPPPALPFAPPRTAKVGFLARGIPAHGYKAFRAVCGPPPGTSEASGAGSIENEFFEVSADPGDGSVTVRDKATGRVLRGLNRLVDGGDRGDEYNYEPPSTDTVIGRPSSAPKITITERGPARSTLEIEMTYVLPAGLSADRKVRSRKTVKCSVRCLVHLYAGVRRVDFRTEVDNQARDHRLRAHFPTGVHSDVTHAEQHFGVISRPMAIPQADETWMEQPAGTHPQKAFVDVSDGRQGLLLANRGLPEYEALPGPEGVTLALTLLRCVGWLSRPDLSVRKGPAGPTVETPGAQCPGCHVFEYALVPHEGGWQNAFVEAHRFARPMRTAPASGAGALPPSAALVEVRPSRLVVSAIKAEEDGRGLVVRLYNVSDRAVRGRVRLTEPCGRVEIVNLNEESLGEAPVEDGWVPVSAKRNESVSLLFHARLKD